MKLFFYTLLITLFFTGCANTQSTLNLSDMEAIKQSVIVGESTQESVIQKLGEPHNRDIRGNKVTWYYNNSIKDQGNILVVEFDAYGFVQDYSIVK